MKNTIVNKLIKEIIVIAFGLVLIMDCLIGTAYASYTSQDLQSIVNQTPFYYPECSTSTTVSPGTGSPNGSTFPNLNPTSMANAINTYISKQNPQSEMSGLGSTIVADAQHANVSPFIIVAIAQKESSLSSPTDYNVEHGNNSFGRTAGPGQPSFQGARSWYYWSSVKASVDYTAPENQGISGGGDFASYLRDQYGNALNSDNLLSFFEAYNPVSDGGNPPAYAALVQSIVNTLSGTSNTTTSSSSSTTNCGSSSTINCNSSSSSTSGLSTVRQNVVCIAQQQLAIWSSQPGYPWNGPNTYSETGYLQYSAGNHEEWCADFASWVYNQAGYPFSGGYNGGWRISYVPNIQALGQQNGNFHWNPSTSYTPKPGDLAIHGANHVNIVVSVNGSTITLIGGDQGNGPYPGGSIVSTEVISSVHADGITGYVSPD